MKSCRPSDIVITGIGLISAIGKGKAENLQALMQGSQRFAIMQRPGRQHAESAFIGAEIPPFDLPERVPARSARTASLSTHAALVALDEAWTESRLEEEQHQRIGLIVGGSNFQQRELALVHEAFRGRESYVRPTYAQTYLDTDLSALCSELYGIDGTVQTLGGASASGAMAIIQAAKVVASGEVDACVAVGALMDLSHWECQAFRSLGAMGSDRFQADPSSAYRPFDTQRDGFIYGESCAALVVERLDSARVVPYARLAAWSVHHQPNRGMEPSLEGEIQVMHSALDQAGWCADEVDYINPHGSGSLIGDETEYRALAHCGLSSAFINTTKSLLGHGLSSAGAVEVAATLMQMRAGRLHPCRNLDAPLGDARWLAKEPIAHRIEKALKLSFGFGGISTALALARMP